MSLTTAATATHADTRLTPTELLLKYKNLWTAETKRHVNALATHATPRLRRTVMRSMTLSEGLAAAQYAAYRAAERYVSGRGRPNLGFAGYCRRAVRWGLGRWSEKEAGFSKNTCSGSDKVYLRLESAEARPGGCTGHARRAAAREAVSLLRDALAGTPLADAVGRVLAKSAGDGPPLARQPHRATEEVRVESARQLLGLGKEQRRYAEVLRQLAAKAEELSRTSAEFAAAVRALFTD